MTQFLLTMWAMKFSDFLVFSLCLVTTYSLRAIESVTVRGPTVGPGYSRISSPFWKCPPKYLPVSNGQLCCDEPIRHESCPGYSTNPLVQFEDDPVCCQGSFLPCSWEKCNSYSVLRTVCPTEYPYPIVHGTRCCLYKTRSANCPTGSPGTLLDPSDPEECCSSSRFIECSTKWRWINVHQWGICSEKVCEKSIHSSDPAIHVGGQDFSAKNVLFETCEYNKYGYYITPNYQVNIGFVVDFGCVQIIERVMIKNTRDFPDGVRATNGFKVEVSMDTLAWTEIVQSNLTSVFHLDCADVPLEVFAASAYVEARFLKFTTLSYFGFGGGINYLTWTTL